MRRFYEQVGQRLKRWQPAAPKIAETPKETENLGHNTNEAAGAEPAPLPPSTDLPDSVDTELVR